MYAETEKKWVSASHLTTRPSEELVAGGCQAVQVTGDQYVDAMTNLLPGKAPTTGRGTETRLRDGRGLKVMP